MWIHVTWLGIVQTLIALALIVLNQMVYMAWTWFRHGTAADQRTTSSWLLHLAAACAMIAVDGLYVLWIL